MNFDKMTKKQLIAHIGEMEKARAKYEELQHQLHTRKNGIFDTQLREARRRTIPYRMPVNSTGEGGSILLPGKSGILNLLPVRVRNVLVKLDYKPLDRITFMVECEGEIIDVVEDRVLYPGVEAVAK